MTRRLRSVAQWTGAVLWLAFCVVVTAFLIYLAVTFVWALTQLTLAGVWGVDL